MLGLSRGSSRNLQPTTVSGSEKQSHKSKNGIAFPLIDGGSTSAKRKPGGYLLPLLFAPRSDDLCLSGTPPETDVLQHLGTGYEAEDDHDRSLNEHEVHLCPEPSETTDCSFAATSGMITGATSGEQRGRPRHPKKCRFNGCSKGARGASGLYISHGGGQRCQKTGCNKGAESRTAYCKAPGLFSGIVSTSSTAGSSMDHVISSSGPSASSDCGESLEDMQSGKLLIPHQVLVPGSMKSSSSCGLAGNGQEDGGSQNQSSGFVVPEGRVHGGGLMPMLGAGGNLDESYR